jgi:hypothetical protein
MSFAKSVELPPSQTLLSLFQRAVPERAVHHAKETVMQLLLWPLAVTVLTVEWLLPLPAANAQAQSPAPGLSDHAPNIPDQKLDAAVAAMQRVAVLKQSYQQQIAAAPAQSDKERIAAEGVNALTKARHGSGSLNRGVRRNTRGGAERPWSWRENSSASPTVG